MILQHFEIQEEHNGYSGRATIRDGERVIQIVFGNDDVVRIMEALQRDLPDILKFYPNYGETFLPKPVKVEGVPF